VDVVVVERGGRGSETLPTDFDGVAVRHDADELFGDELQELVGRRSSAPIVEVSAVLGERQTAVPLLLHGSDETPTVPEVVVHRTRRHAGFEHDLLNREVVGGSATDQ